MLYLTQSTQILLAVVPIDFRRQFDGLIALCEQQFSLDARSGQMFVFINKAHTMIRVLYYEGDGYWLATKRLSHGRYSLWPQNSQSGCSPVLAHELTKILKTSVASKRQKI